MSKFDRITLFFISNF